MSYICMYIDQSQKLLDILTKEQSWKNSPIDICDGPEILEHGSGQQVPYLGPDPRRLVDGVV